MPKTLQICDFYNTSLTLNAEAGGKSDWFSRLPVNGFLVSTNVFQNSKSSNQGDISQKHKVRDFMTLVGTISGMRSGSKSNRFLIFYFDAYCI